MKYSISSDELNFYNQTKENLQEPGRKAVEVLEAGINMILTELGVNIDGDIKQQQNNLGIIIQEHTGESAAHLNGFYIHQVRDGDIVPIAFIGSARIDSSGKAWIDVEHFQRDKKKATGGIPIIK